MNRSERRAGPPPARSEAYWEQRIRDGVPVHLSRMGRTFWLTPRQASVVAAGLSGPFAQRALAERLGYSLTGLWHALQAISRLGIARFSTTLGCRGRTRMTLSSDASRRNVPSTVTPSESVRESLRRSVVETFDREAYDLDLRRRFAERLGVPLEVVGL